MTTFSNNLDTELELYQFSEIIEIRKNKMEKRSRTYAIGLGVFTGTIVASSSMSVNNNDPSIIVYGLLGCACVASAVNLYKLHQRGKLFYNIDFSKPDEINLKELRKKQRERRLYDGDIKIEKGYTFYCENSKDVEEIFGNESDNDLPIQFLPKAEVPERILHEYDMYALKYDVPQLTINKLDLTIFTDLLEEFLKKKLLSHRIYHYTTMYFRRILIKALVNYQETLSVEDLLSEIDIFEVEEFTKEDINEFKEKIKNTLLQEQTNIKQEDKGKRKIFK